MTSRKPKQTTAESSKRPRSSAGERPGVPTKSKETQPRSGARTEREVLELLLPPGTDLDDEDAVRRVLASLQEAGRIFDDPLLTEDEAARMLSLSPLTLKKWRRTNRGPRYYRLGSAVRYSREDLEAYASRSAENPQELGHTERGGR